MPPFVSTTCPKCRHTFTVDMAKLQTEAQVVYRGEGKTQHEYRVRCPKCGYAFKITYPPSPPSAGERP